MPKFKTIKTIIFYAALMAGIVYIAPMATQQLNQSTQAWNEVGA